LSVYGKFVANILKMGRTFGSLRDETPVTVSHIVTAVTDSPVALQQYSCATGNGGNSYQHSHWYEAGGAPPTPATCPSPSFEATDGYVFATNDSTFTSTYLTGAYSVDVLCEYELAISGANDHYMETATYTPGFTCANAFPLSAPYDPVTVGYVFAGASGTEPLYQYYDSSLYGVTGYHYYTINDAGPLVDNVTEEFDGAVASVYKTAANGAVTSSQTVAVTAAPTPAQLQALNGGTGCSNNGGGGWLSPETCAAEVFYDTPELYLSTPNVGQPSFGATQWQAVTGLPPLL